MAKADLKKQLKVLYNIGASAKKPHYVDVPEPWYVMVDGTGDPAVTELYHKSVAALYTVAYGVKFVAKDDGSDFGVMPLEGLWWSDPPESFSMDARDRWKWTSMILQPDWIITAMVEAALERGVKKGKIDPETWRGRRALTLQAHRLRFTSWVNQNPLESVTTSPAFGAGSLLPTRSDLARRAL